MKLKIVEYNILDGIHTFDGPPKLQKERLQQVKQVIKSLNPDERRQRLIKAFNLAFRMYDENSKKILLPGQGYAV